MTKYLNVKEERGGFRHLYLGAIVAVALVVVAALAWSLFSPPPPNQPNGQRTDQQSGASTVAKQTAPPPTASPNATTPETVGRNARIEATGNEKVNLDAGQRKAVDDFVAQHAEQKKSQVDFTIAVGAAVPRSVSLDNIPAELATKLSAHSDAQYLIVANQFVIVEKPTRRIIAIIPAAT
jgi:cytoskeletal protein RodZ